QRERAHQLARRAEAALRRVVRHERLLERVQRAVLDQTFDRLDRPAVHPGGELAAGVDGLAVDEHGAGAALAAVAADLGAGEIQLIAEELGEGPAVVDLDAAAAAVEGERDRMPRAGADRRRLSLSECSIRL